MSYLPITILAYLLNSIAVIIDKFLLNKSIPNPLTYIFYISIFSLLILFALPFTLYPSPFTLFLASASTLLWTIGAYLMFAAVKKGQVSRVVPVIGTLIPLMLLIHAAFFGTISLNQSLAVGILIAGLIFLTYSDLHLKEVKLEFLSALFFAVSYLILREAYLRENFLTVLVYSRLILIPLILIFLFIPKPHHKPKIGALFITGQAAGGASQLLLTFSISLASPALINSLQGIQYVFLFFFSMWVFKEKFSFFNILGKIMGIGLIGTGLYLLAGN